MKVTLYQNTWGKPIVNLPLSEIVDKMQSGEYTAAVLSARENLLRGHDFQYNELKKKLQAFTISGTFAGRRKEQKYTPPTAAELQVYNGIIGLDYDKLVLDSIQALRGIAKTDPCVLLGFRSPSGGGYKLFVQTDNKDPKHHKTAYLQVKRYYDNLVGEKADPSCKNITRLCYVSVWDEYAHYKETTKFFEIKTNEGEQSRLFVAPVEQSKKRYEGRNLLPVTEWAVKYIESSKGGNFVFTEGKRHDYVMKWAVAVVKGTPIDEAATGEANAINFALTNFVGDTLSERELKGIIKWAFANVDERGILSNDRTIEDKQQANSNVPIQQVASTDRNKPYEEEEHQLPTYSIPALEDEAIESVPAAIRQKMWAASQMEQTLKQFYDFIYNEVTDWYEYKPKEGGYKYERLTDRSYNQLKKELLKRGIPSSVKGIKELIKSYFSTRCNPIKEMFKGWANRLGDTDKRDYIAELAACVPTDAPEVHKNGPSLWELSLRRWMVASVANVYNSRQCTNHHCLILVGKQGVGKTGFWDCLFPSEYTSSGHLRLGTKDVDLSLTQCFIISLDEQFAHLVKQEHWEILKDLITRNGVKERRVYGTDAEFIPRIANFCGSTDKDMFLQDGSGERRFLPFNVTGLVDFPKLKPIVKQAWAQAFKLYKARYNYLPKSGEMSLLEEYRASFKKVDDVQEHILQIYEPWVEGRDEAPEKMTVSAAEVAAALQRRGLKDVSGDRTGKALKALGFVQKVVTIEVGKKKKRGRRYLAKGRHAEWK